MEQISLPLLRSGQGLAQAEEELLEAVPNARTVPQIFLDGQLIGGFTELKTKLTESK